MSIPFLQQYVARYSLVLIKGSELEGYMAPELPILYNCGVASKLQSTSVAQVNQHENSSSP